HRIPLPYGHAVGADADPVMKKRYRIVGDDMPGAIHLDRVVAVDRMRAVQPRIRPAEDPMAIVAAEEDVVGDVEILRSGELRVDADADVFNPAVADDEPRGASDVFHSRPE